MTPHLPECYLAQPCRSNGGKEHVMQGTIAGFPVTICGLCMDDCICDPLRKAFQRGREYQQKRLTNHDMHSGYACLTNYEQGVKDERARIRRGVELKRVISVYILPERERNFNSGINAALDVIDHKEDS